jgi:hypothetical protein
MPQRTLRSKAMRGRIALQKQFVRNVGRRGGAVSRQLWECARIRAPLFRFTALNRFQLTRVAKEPARMLAGQDRLRSPRGRRGMQ